MRIFDCFMFYDEEVVLDIRLNSLKNSVDCFVIVESKYYHNGKKRDLKFDINKYSKLKDKIIYIVQDEEPSNLEQIKKNDEESLITQKIISNAHKRENFQRNLINKGLDKANEDDLIMISDVDEIPNLKDLNVARVNNKIVIFEQNIFYYKLNRYLEGFTWYGTKACKKKNLISPQWLRNIKSKKYPFWRIDTFFSKKKYSNLYHIKDGGWHFTCIRTPEDLENKLLNFAHHYEFEESGLKINDIKKLIKEKRVMYDHNIDQRGYKWSGKSILQKIKLNLLPEYISSNAKKFDTWLD